MSGRSGQRSVSVEHAIAFGLLTGVGIFAFVTALGYGLVKEGGLVGPGLVPAVVGAGITLIAGWELLSTLRGRMADHSGGLAEVAASVAADPAAPTGAAVADAVPGGGSAPPAGGVGDDVDIYGRSAATRGRQLVVVFAALAAAVLLVGLLGFLGSFFLLSVFISAVVERRRWLPSVLVSLAAVVAVYAVFVLFLNVPLPTGLIGIGG